MSISNNSQHIKVYFLLLPDVHLLDLFGPAHVFQEATLLGGNYEIIYIGISEMIQTSFALALSSIQNYKDIELSMGDILMIPGIATEALIF